MAIDAPSGRPLWSHDTGGPGKAGVSAAQVVVSGPSGTVWAMDRSTGNGLWQQAALARRNVTGVAIQGDYAVVGDYDGYLHWMNLSDGAFAARMRAGRDPLRAAPVVSSDGILVAEDTDGSISAYRLSP
jgi:outer membrane protein assembly factor BamB